MVEQEGWNVVTPAVSQLGDHHGTSDPARRDQGKTMDVLKKRGQERQLSELIHVTTTTGPTRDKGGPSFPAPRGTVIKPIIAHSSQNHVQWRSGRWEVQDPTQKLDSNNREAFGGKGRKKQQEKAFFQRERLEAVVIGMGVGQTYSDHRVQEWVRW